MFFFLFFNAFVPRTWVLSRLMLHVSSTHNVDFLETWTNIPEMCP